MRLRITAAVTGPFQVNSYLVACEDSGEALLIDPGGDSPELSAQLRQADWRLRWIVNTHGHADHIAGNDHWAAATGAQIVIHRLDWEFFRTPAMQAAARAEGFPPLTRADVLVEDGDQFPWATAVPGYSIPRATRRGASASISPAICSPGTPCLWMPPDAPTCRGLP